MAVSITRSLADDYFDTRIDKQLWDSFKTGDRDKAIQTAIDVISRALGSAVTSETVDTNNYYYPDRACYHQALFVLVNSDYTANGEFTGPKWPGATKGGQPKEVDTGEVCREALRWMNWRSGPTIRIAKG